MKYAKIVQYVKENHISWDTDIFDILKDYTSQLPPVDRKEMDEDRAVLSHTIKGLSGDNPIHSSLLEVADSYQMPHKGEYTFEDVIELFER
jgi:hypothetical protein